MDCSSKTTRVANDKAMNAICSTLSPSKCSRISKRETAKEVWDILETTYEGTKLVKSAKLQMLVSEFERIRMLEDETFNEFYDRISDLRNSMINLGKKVSDTKLIKKIFRSLPKRFRIKATTIEESKDLDNMKIEELVGSFQTYELSLPHVKKAKSIALKAVKGKSKNYSKEEFDDEDGITMFTRNLRDLLNSEGDPKGTELEEVETNKKDLYGPKCVECLGFGHFQEDCETSSRRKERLSMLLSMIIQVKIRGFWLLMLHMLILRSPKVVMKKN